MGGTPKQNMERVWQAIVREYQALRTSVQYSSIEIKTFVDPDKPFGAYPKLKGKGIECRDLGIPLFRAYIALANPSWPQH
eukprot:9583702-Alexandrium_andersonii.AAC.1